jgi:hypothetical protein
MWRTVHIISLLGLLAAAIYVALPLFDIYSVISGRVQPHRFGFTFSQIEYWFCFVGIMLSLRVKSLQSLANK